MKITLTPQQEQQLELMHDTERDRRVCDRIKAILLASEGWSQAMISQALRIHESTVARHLSDYVFQKSFSLKKVMNEKSRNNVYLKNKRDLKAAIDQFFTVTLPEIADSLTSRINDNFQVLKPASSS